MTSRRGISRAEQKKRRSRPVEANDRPTPAFRRAKSFAALDGVAIRLGGATLHPTRFSIRETPYIWNTPAVKWAYYA